jgi:hypothetical protein
MPSPVGTSSTTRVSGWRLILAPTVAALTATLTLILGILVLVAGTLH